LMQVQPPQLSTADVQNNLIAAIKRDGINKIEKCLIYAPDGIGQTIQIKYPGLFSGIHRIINHSEPLQSVYPPMTPVCYAAMFTGTSPEINGISTYVRPVLKIETIFDAMLKAAKKVAIIAVTNSSIDLIFKERTLDYYSESDDAKVIETALNVIDKYDFMVLYNQEYDSKLHRGDPFSETCLDAVAHHNQAYLQLAEAIDKAWGNYDRLLVYAPDHGAHLNPDNNMGTHGQNIPEDMDLLHHYVYFAAKR
jgi:hypothetical protein